MGLILISAAGIVVSYSSFMNIVPRAGHVRFKPMSITTAINFETIFSRTDFHWKKLVPYKKKFCWFNIAVAECLKVWGFFYMMVVFLDAKIK